MMPPVTDGVRRVRYSYESKAYQPIDKARISRGVQRGDASTLRAPLLAIIYGTPQCMYLVNKYFLGAQVKASK